MPDNERSPDYRWIVVGLSFVAQFSNALAALAVAPLAALFQPELGLTKAQVGFFSSAGFAGAWGVLLVAGSLTDRFGVRRMMSIGQFASGLFILAMASAGSFVHATAVMLAAGVGRGITAPGITKSVVDWFPTVGRATAVAINQTAIPIAGVATAMALPPLALLIGWRGASATVGALILCGAVATALLYRDRNPATSSRAPSGVTSNLGAVLRNRRLWVVTGVGCLLAGVQFSVTAYLALFYKELILVPLIPDERARIVAAGGCLAAAHLGSFAARLLWGMAGDRFFARRRLLLLAIASAVAAVSAVAMSWLQPGASEVVVVVAAFLAGLTMMGMQGIYLLVGAETAGPKNAGSGVGLFMTGTQFGFVVAPTVFGVVIDVTGSYTPAWFLLAAMGAVAAVVAGVMGIRK